MDKKHNQILLTTEDGRTVSIVQGEGTMGRSGQTCEIWVAGEEQPVGYLTVEELSKYLVEKVK
tara:strand:+ start:138 stop:326 length:189 start_codon:yes stop_codon:yes gene_type:complete